jgi:hypothetical protein
MVVVIVTGFSELLQNKLFLIEATFFVLLSEICLIAFAGHKKNFLNE